MTAMTLEEAALAVSQGRVSSVELVRQTIGRIEQLNPRLNCFLRVDADIALEEARRADDARSRGLPLGPLHGVPIALKDMFYDPVRQTTSGSRLRAGFVAHSTATVVSRLRRAGAINVGALHMTEFALGPTGHNAHHGPCRNAWNPDYISGGSSSGSGTAVAAGLVFGALGSDTGGSVRVPAAANGVLGLKPTYGRVPRTAMMNLSWSTDHVGPIARNARDLALIYAAIAGHDPLDATSSHRPVGNPTDELSRGVQGLRIGIPTHYYFEAVDADVNVRLQSALADLATAGAILVPVSVPEPAALADLSRMIVYAEAAALHGAWLRTRADEYSPQVRARILTGLALPAPLYLEALQLRAGLLRRFVEQVFSECDVMATPTLAPRVPTIEETDVGAGASMWQLLARLVRCTAPFNYLGVPALAVPTGPDANGLPTSLQLVARPFAENRLLTVAAALESVRGAPLAPATAA